MTIRSEERSGGDRQDLLSLDAAGLVRWAVETYGDRLVLACSTSVEDAVVTHLAAATGRPVRVFLLDTGRLHPETYETYERLRRRYPTLVFQVFAPAGPAVEALVAAQGLFGFREGLEARHACCAVRKLEPLQRALAGAEAWLTGLRHEQGPTRTGLERVQREGDRLKVSPLLDWSSEEVLAFAEAHRVPIHPLHHLGYPSIGCAPCTRVVLPGEPPRAGRWWWELPEHKECGLHR